MRQAAAISLGIISIGNTNFFLQKVFEMIDKSPMAEKYMFLSTVREIIIIRPDCLDPYLQSLMPLYLAQSNSADEPIRNIVAESIGKLFITHPTVLSPYIEKAFASNDMNTIATYAKSFKYSSHNNSQPHFFQPFIGNLIGLIGNLDLSVRRYTLESLSMMFYNS